MKELSLKELQQVSSSVLKDVHDFCVANEIHYSLAYGTLIGAKRHKGFIPWDDDLDIFMTPEQYEKLNLEGMVVTATMASGEKKDVTSACTTNPKEGYKFYGAIASLFWSEDQVKKSMEE